MSPPPLTPSSVTGDPDSMSLSKRWRHRVLISEHLWQRWKREYLQSLRNWRSTVDKVNSPKVGDLVLVQAKPLPRRRWPLAIIAKLFGSSDGHVRAALLKVKGWLTRRPLRLLYRLESCDPLV